MAAAIGFENFASGIGVAVVAYMSHRNLRFTATQRAAVRAGSIAGRFSRNHVARSSSRWATSTYVLTTLIALPGAFLYWWVPGSPTYRFEPPARRD
jgi:hypothetical protein